MARHSQLGEIQEYRERCGAGERAAVGVRAARAVCQLKGSSLRRLTYAAQEDARWLTRSRGTRTPTCGRQRSLNHPAVVFRAVPPPAPRVEPIRPQPRPTSARWPLRRGMRSSIRPGPRAAPHGADGRRPGGSPGGNLGSAAATRLHRPAARRGRSAPR